MQSTNGWSSVAKSETLSQHSECKQPVVVPEKIPLPPKFAKNQVISEVVVEVALKEEPIRKPQRPKTPAEPEKVFFKPEIITRAKNKSPKHKTALVTPEKEQIGGSGKLELFFKPEKLSPRSAHPDKEFFTVSSCNLQGKKSLTLRSKPVLSPKRKKLDDDIDAVSGLSSSAIEHYENYKRSQTALGKPKLRQLNLDGEGNQGEDTVTLGKGKAGLNEESKQPLETVIEAPTQTIQTTVV